MTLLTVSPTKSLRWLQIAAIAEACSWVALLIGMFFKYIVVENEIGVKIFGPVHGVLFLGYLATVGVAARTHHWRPSRWLMGLLAGIPPLCTIWFERFVMKREIRHTTTEPDRATATLG